MTRVRRLDDVDLSVAIRTCKTCYGTGVKETKEIEFQGRKERVPVVCSCVTLNGGVKKDALDKAYEQAEQDLRNGSFVEKQVAIIQGMPRKFRRKMLRKYEKVADRPDTPAYAAQALRAIIAHCQPSTTVH